MSESMAEWIAREFHEAYVELAPSIGYEMRQASAVPWADVPEKKKRLMIAVAQRLLDDRVIETAGTARRGY